MRKHVIGLAGFALMGMILFGPDPASAGGAESMAPLSCSSEASAVTSSAPEAEAEKVFKELQNLFSPRSDCYSHRCQTHTECTQICGDVAKCCALPSCYGGAPGSGSYGYCVMM
jgi:hypothetical protein